MLGFSAMLLSILLFSLMDASVKWLGAIYPTAQIMFFRCSVALVPVLVIVALRGLPFHPREKPLPASSGIALNTGERLKHARGLLHRSFLSARIVQAG